MIHIKPAKNGQFTWCITARNGRIFTSSETYKTMRAVYKSIEAFHKLVRLGGIAHIKNHVLDAKKHKAT